MKKRFFYAATILVLTAIVLSRHSDKAVNWLGEDLFSCFMGVMALLGLARLLAGAWATFDFNTRTFSSRAEQVYWRKKVFGRYLGIILHFGDLEYLYHFHRAGVASRPVEELPWIFGL